MLIDCNRCTARGAACSGCVMTLLFAMSPPTEAPEPVDAASGTEGLDEAERRAVATLARAGFEVSVIAQSDSRRGLRLVPRSRGSAA